MGVVRIGAEDFDPADEIAAAETAADSGALASFLGIVRGGGARPVVAMTLEHYPAMTERAVARMVAEAEARFALSACRVIHRTGRIPVGGRIVSVVTASAHRKAALEATTFLIDWLKVGAPFWKKEHFADGSEAWVEARSEDDAAAARWKG